MTLGAPLALTDQHDCADFNCGRDLLDTWLKQRARRNQASGATRTFVICDAGRVIAYYALAAGAVDIGLATGRLRRNQPDPVPAVVLGRLAVDRSHQGLGLGRALVYDAGRRVVGAAEIIGIRGLLVHALDAEAGVFYQRLGFDRSPFDPLMLMITVADLRVSW